jgi:hypothetical protein
MQCRLLVTDATGGVRWSWKSPPETPCFGVWVDETPLDAAGVVHLWFSWGDWNSRVAVQPTADSMRDFATLATADDVGRFPQSDAYDVNGDGRIEIVQSADCGSDCIPAGYWTYYFDGDDFVTFLCVRPDIDFAAVRTGSGTDQGQVGEIPPGTCDVASTVGDLSTGEMWRHVAYGDVSGWAHDSLFVAPPVEPLPEVAGSSGSPGTSAEQAAAVATPVTDVSDPAVLVRSAAIPSLCGHQPGALVDGALPASLLVDDLGAHAREDLPSSAR